MTMEPFTRSKLESVREWHDAYYGPDYIKEAVETIYHGARDVAMKRSDISYIYNIEMGHFANSIRDKLVVLFPDFQVQIERGIIPTGRTIRIMW